MYEIKFFHDERTLFHRHNRGLEATLGTAAGRWVTCSSRQPRNRWGWW